MLGIQGTGRQSLHKVDDWGGAQLPGEAAGAHALSIVSKCLSEGVTCGASPNPAQHGKRGVGVGGQQVNRGTRDKDV